MTKVHPIKDEEDSDKEIDTKREMTNKENLRISGEYQSANEYHFSVTQLRLRGTTTENFNIEWSNWSREHDSPSINVLNSPKDTIFGDKKDNEKKTDNEKVTINKSSFIDQKSDSTSQKPDKIK